MHENLSDTEIIRRVALKILAEHHEGVRSTTLKMYTEQQLGKYIPPDTHKSRGKFRSAIWNLDEKYPDYVRKESPRPKLTIFYPTDKLKKEWDAIEIPDLEELKQEEMVRKQKTSEMLSQYIYYHTIVAKEPISDYITKPNIMEIISETMNTLHDWLGTSGIYELIKEAIEQRDSLSDDEVEALFRLRFCLDLITKYRKELLHKKI